MPLPRPRRVDIDEHMDADDADPADIAGALDDLSRLNQFVGGNRLTLRALDHARAKRFVPEGSLRILDVATGAGDMPRAMLDHLAQQRVDVHVTGLDIKPEMLDEARRRTTGLIDYVQGDALAMPYDDDSFDVVTCSLMLHHFQPAAAVAVLAEMRRVSAHVVVVNDLIRAWHPWLFAKVVGPLVTRNPLTRFDGPVSVLRAYAPDELLELLDEAGLVPRWRATLLGYRMAVVATAT
ncbi:MAG: Methyltransferase type 11 [Thermoleophilia bacterium]|nr:Methyltransferase type 11 [Thermoleophilia bacterium]